MINLFFDRQQFSAPRISTRNALPLERGDGGGRCVPTPSSNIPLKGNCPAPLGMYLAPSFFHTFHHMEVVMKRGFDNTDVAQHGLFAVVIGMILVAFFATGRSFAAENYYASVAS